MTLLGLSQQIDAPDGEMQAERYGMLHSTFEYRFLDVLDEIYTVAKANLRPVHEMLMESINTFGEFEIAPQKAFCRDRSCHKHPGGSRDQQ